MSITARGGYQIADFKNISIPVDNTTVEIPGIFEQIYNGDKKPIVANNLNIKDGFLRGIYYPDIMVFRPNMIVLVVSNGNLIYHINISNTDTVRADEID